MSFCYDYPRPAVTVDAAVFLNTASGWQVLLIQRGREPFRGKWALPGGFLDMNETPEEAVARELQEETGLNGIGLQQLHTFGAIHRDPRHRTLSVVFWGITDEEHSITHAGDDADASAWFPVGHLPELAFDHAQVLEMAIRRLP